MFLKPPYGKSRIILFAATLSLCLHVSTRPENEHALKEDIPSSISVDSNAVTSDKVSADRSFPYTFPYFFPIREGNSWTYAVSRTGSRHRYIISASFSGGGGIDDAVLHCRPSPTVDSIIVYKIVECGEGESRHCIIEANGVRQPCESGVLSLKEFNEYLEGLVFSDVRWCQYHWKLPAIPSDSDNAVFEEIVVGGDSAGNTISFRRILLVSGPGNSLAVKKPIRLNFDLIPYRTEFFCTKRVLSPFDRSARIFEISKVTMGECGVFATSLADSNEAFLIEAVEEPVSSLAGTFTDCVECSHWEPIIAFPNHGGVTPELWLTKSVFCNGVGLVIERQYDYSGELRFSMNLIDFDIKK